MVVEDIGNQHENAEFGFRNKEELLEDAKKMLKNLSEVRRNSLGGQEHGKVKLKILTKIWRD